MSKAWDSRWSTSGLRKANCVGVGCKMVAQPWMLQEFRKEGHDFWVFYGKVGDGVSVCFIYEDALTIYREVTSRGIKASRPFVGNGMWVTSLSARTVIGSSLRATQTCREAALSE
jgi:hypothetical protein